MSNKGGRHGKEEETKGQGSAGVRFRQEQEECEGAHPRAWVGIGVRDNSRCYYERQP